MKLDELILDTMCPRCEARPGEKCKTVTGGRATWPHSARTGPIYQAWGLGYTEAREGGE